jgi:hypothetical protein
MVNSPQFSGADWGDRAIRFRGKGVKSAQIFRVDGGDRAVLPLSIRRFLNAISSPTFGVSEPGRNQF